jgi:hypothetical protein
MLSLWELSWSWCLVRAMETLTKTQPMGSESQYTHWQSHSRHTPKSLQRLSQKSIPYHPQPGKLTSEHTILIAQPTTARLGEPRDLHPTILSTHHLRITFNQQAEKGSRVSLWASFAQQRKCQSQLLEPQRTRYRGSPECGFSLCPAKCTWGCGFAIGSVVVKFSVLSFLFFFGGYRQKSENWSVAQMLWLPCQILIKETGSALNCTYLSEERTNWLAGISEENDFNFCSIIKHWLGCSEQDEINFTTFCQRRLCFRKVLHHLGYHGNFLCIVCSSCKYTVCLHSYVSAKILIRDGLSGWWDGSAVKSTDCSSEGHEFKSQQPHGGSQPPVMRSDALFWYIWSQLQCT